MLRPPGNATLVTHRSVVVTCDFGSREHAVPAHPAAITAAHTPKSEFRVAIDTYRSIDQQDGPAGAKALAVGGVNGHRSKWSAAIGLGGAWPPDRSWALPTSWLGGDRLRPPINRAADAHGGAVSAGRGTRWVSCGYLTAQILAFLAARFGLGLRWARTVVCTHKDTAEAVTWRSSQELSD